LKKIYHLHVKLNEDEHNLLERYITLHRTTKSGWIREKVRELEKEIPEELENKENELLKELEEIRKKKESFKRQFLIERENKEKVMEGIYHDFVRYSRINYPDSLNLEWSKARYGNVLDIPPKEILSFCKERWKNENER